MIRRRRPAVRERVNLLAVIPLLVVILLAIPLLAARLDQARAATAADRSAAAAGRVSSLIEMIQRARLLSVAFTSTSEVAPNSLTVQLQEIDQRRAELVADPKIAELPDLRNALDRLQLDYVGTSVLTGWGSDLQAVEDYGAIVEGLVDALALNGNTLVDREGAATLETLDALLRSDEAASKRTAMLLLAATNPTNRERALTSAREMGILANVTAAQFRRIARASDTALFTLADGGPTAKRLAAAESVLTAAGPRTETSDRLAAEVLAAGQAQTEIRQLVESRIAREAVERAERELSSAWWTTVMLSGLGLAFLALVLGLSVVVGRSVTQPLQSLTLAAGQVADLAQEELLHVADEDAQEARVPRLAAIDVRSEDEIGDLATAFNRVQATAALLLERQVTSRRNVAAMFASMGRRTSNLVGRQLALIDSLERAEEDPDTLATLYRLDHTATRLRRSASSLVILSGGTENLGEGQPMTIGDVVRAALGTVEGYQRVTLQQVPTSWVDPGTVGDLSLLLAELLDNALAFSPPRTQVEVAAGLSVGGGCVISVTDHGMGMPEARLAEENGRLRRRERLDLAPTDLLGLFVVGRISRRHGIDVQLTTTPGSGLTAVVTLPAALMVDGLAAVPPRSAPAVPEQQTSAGPFPGEAPAERAPAGRTPRGLPRRGKVPVGEIPAGPVPPSSAPVRTTDDGIASDRQLAALTGWSAPQSPSQPPSPSPAPSPMAEPGAGRPGTGRPGAGQPGTGQPGGGGLVRRVRGKSLAGLGLGAEAPPPLPSTPRPIDADALRKELLDVEAAVDRARRPPAGGRNDAATPTASDGIELARRAPGRALRDFDRVFVPSREYRARFDEDGAPRTLAQRVRGASLSTDPEGPGIPAGGPMDKDPSTGSIALVPEHPEDVLAWARGLETAMDRLGPPKDERPDAEGDL